MKKNSLKQNFVFQMIYQILIYAIPLVIAPYLTRTLGGKSLGIYTYVNSIAYYFLLFINLGINRHGQRVIASTRDNDIKLRKSFWSLLSFHTIVSIIGIFAYIIFIVFFCKNNRTIFLIQTMYVLSAFVDITWLFYGLENFKSVAIKNMMVKIFECVCIFSLVKNTNDLVVYTIIVSISVLLGQAIMIPQALKIVKPIRFSVDDVKQHIKPMCVLFISVIATTLYTVFDKTLLGMLSNTIENVAYYEYANKIVTIPKVIISVVGTVIFPRACKCAAEHDRKSQKQVMKFSCIMASILGSASVFGLAAVAKKLSIVYYGAEFVTSGEVMICMAPLILIVCLGDTFRSGYLIPSHKDNVYVISNVTSAVLNLIASSLLIPYIGIYGAISGTLLAEIIGFILQAYACRCIFGLKDIIETLFPALGIGLIMYIVVYKIDKITAYNFKWLGCEIIIGIAVYFVGILIISNIFYKDYLKIILRKNKK